MLYSGAGYTILIMTFFYIFALSANLESTAIGVGKFFLILAFGMITAIAELIYELLSLRKVFKCLIHYAILLAAFCIIFIAGDFFNITGPASVFVAITVFTLIYAVCVGIVYLVRRGVAGADKAIDSRINKGSSDSGKASKKKQDKNNYTPRFK